MKIQMVDLRGQYQRIKSEVDAAINEVLQTTAFINGPAVSKFANELAAYSNIAHVIPCGNGTDALQLAMMALELNPGDEVIVPSFTYVATVEVIVLLGLKPVFVDVDADTYMISAVDISRKITPKTKAIVPVHLFGQCADMESIMALAHKHNIPVIEDTAQAAGAEYTFKDGTVKKAGTIGTIGTTSFFPSKNLGCFGDGGALLVQDDLLAEKLKMIANHGQKIKYYHDIVGVNSRLDTIQAAILRVKLNHLDDYNRLRNKTAEFYDAALEAFDSIKLPKRDYASTHVFHQYTIRCTQVDRDRLKQYLLEHGIPTMVYYPVPLHLQHAYKAYATSSSTFPVSELLASQVLSLPVHTEQTMDELEFITDTIKAFLKKENLN